METNFIAILAGEKKKKSNKYKRFDDRINNLIEDYSNKKITEFLDGISLNILF